MEATLYNQSGKSAGKINLPESLFGVNWNADLVHQVVTSMMGNKRAGTAHTKDRGDVRGGGRKPWKQKGTGRARHGSTRSPIWRKGGVAHGPKSDKNYTRTITKQMKRKALAVILSKKFKDGEVLFVDALSLPTGKTKDALTILSALGGVKGFEAMPKKRTNAVLLALPTNDKMVMRGFKNFGNLSVEEVRNMNPLTLMQYRYLTIVGGEKALESLKVTK